MPIVVDFAAFGLEGATGAPATRISPETPRKDAEQRKQKLALALPVEPAEPDHFARMGMEAKYRAGDPPNSDA